MRKLLTFIFLLLCHLLMVAQEDAATQVRMMFYNVENLIYPDSVASDANGHAVLGRGKQWHYGRYREKLFKIGQVIAGVGEWELPGVIGLCEVGERRVLTDLLHFTALYQYDYQVLHRESADRREMDVALLYRPSLFKLLHHHFIEVPLQREPGAYSRDILYAMGQLSNGDTLHLYVCHFPSRRGGEVSSEPNRLFAAKLIKEHTDSILSSNSTANILLMGDFNDYPLNRSMCEVIRAREVPVVGEERGEWLYNLCWSLSGKGRVGSYKYRGVWGMLDQIIVSGSLLMHGSTTLVARAATLYAPPWLLMEDSKYGDNKPYSTFYGWRYQGGYSDHLPIYVDVACVP